MEEGHLWLFKNGDIGGYMGTFYFALAVKVEIFI